MMNPITLDQVFPQVVGVTLAGRFYLTRELALGQLATLQSWMTAAAKHPLDAVAESVDPSERRRRLVAAWHALKVWPPPLWGEEDGAYLGTTEGRAAFLLVALEPHNPGFDRKQAVALADAPERGGMSPDDWSRLRRIAYAIAPWRAVVAELDIDWLAEQAGRSAEPPDWGGAIIDLVKRDGYGTFEDAARMTIGQWRLYRSGGELEVYRCPMRRGESRADYLRRSADVFRVEGEG